LKRLVVCLTLASAFFASTGTSAPMQIAPDELLFSQTAKARLQREFASPNISWLLMDSSGNLVAERWLPSESSLQTPVPPGSLVKPFLAIAYGEQHNGVFPKVKCLGTKSRCWLPKGHGTLSLEEAIAQSCNAYFLELASHLDRAQAAVVFAQYGLTIPDAAAGSDSLIGLGSGWKEPPLALAKAYLQLSRQQQSSVQSRIVKGMLESAAHGTARDVDAALGPYSSLAKTGTAVCTHTPKGAADGFTVVLYPASAPRLLLLVRVHGITGAASARIAGAMLRSLGAGTER
jgi:cell division protein FtsI/penicillin-binding protein 2